MAIFSNEHPRQGKFFEEVQAVYARYRSDWRDPREEPDISEKIRELAGYVDSTHLFTPVIVRTYPWQRIYSTAEYLALLDTYSDNRAMEAERRHGLLAGIADLIERRFGGQVTKDYLAVSYLARKA